MILKLPTYFMGEYDDIAYDYCVVEDMKPSIKKFILSVWIDVRLAKFYIFDSKYYRR